MNAKVIFINEKEMQATGNQYALASAVCNDQFGEVYIRLEDVLDFVQTEQNACAEEMIKLQEEASDKGETTNTTANHAAWRMCNWILSELKKYRNR